MRYISLFSGIEAASVAWEPLGWEPVAFSEIDPFPCAVLAHRFPNVPNLGDICEIDWSPYHGAVDVVIGGSPCQSFSIAGGRASLDGESRLMFEYIRAIHDIRPRWLIWENVPGVFSVALGLAFAEEMRGGDFVRGEIVRCADCRYLVDDDSSWTCDWHGSCLGLSDGTPPDGFCAWGERRD